GKKMGTFNIKCIAGNHTHRGRKIVIPRILVDTGSEHTWISEVLLKKIGVVSEKKDVRFIMANGQTVSRDVGFAIIYVGDVFTIDEVVFARTGDLQLLGARSLKGLNLVVDSRRKKLVAAGPFPAT
ncbi:MAG: retroviral-like aspartic protease family protein, partial [Elusimicrobia bacterium]|nr:retroviral-like aspartic protease family protein [Elusimicrobiota bacterium]